MDIATIEPGVDFVKDIEQACARKCCQSLQCSPNRVLAVGRPRPRGRWATWHVLRAHEQALSSCAVLIAIIGKQWLTIAGADGRRRLDNPKDYVRLEIATALKRNIRVVPILVQGTTMPRSQSLPAPLAKLARRNALEISDKRFDYDGNKLIETLAKVPSLL